MPTKEGYKFVNWNTKKDGTGTSYNAGSKYTTEASVTLYAQYEKELNEEETKYTITFYTNDGTTEKSTKVVNKGDKVVKPAVQAMNINISPVLLFLSTSSLVLSPILLQ